MMPVKIEEKLKEYRLAKEKEVEALSRKPLLERWIQGRLGKLLTFHTMLNPSTSPDVSLCPVKNNDNVNNCASVNGSLIDGGEMSNLKKKKESFTQIEKDDKNETGRNQGKIKLHSILIFLKIALWTVLYLLFLKLEWGAVYVVFSAFYFMLSNFRKGQRKPWEPSAYSVFNPNCEAIDGTLKPEQLEKQIFYGM